jgi:hypothetical protein
VTAPDLMQILSPRFRSAEVSADEWAVVDLAVVTARSLGVAFQQGRVMIRFTGDRLTAAGRPREMLLGLTLCAARPVEIWLATGLPRRDLLWTCFHELQHAYDAVHDVRVDPAASEQRADALARRGMRALGELD